MEISTGFFSPNIGADVSRSTQRSNQVPFVTSENTASSTNTTSDSENTPLNQTITEFLTLSEQQESDPVEEFLFLGRQQTTRQRLEEERENSQEQENNQDETVVQPAEEPISSQIRDFQSPVVQGNPEATLRKAEEIQRQAQSTGSLSAEERAMVAEARRIGIQARFEIEREQREAQQEERQEELAQERADAADDRRRNAPSPFREITTPFDRVEEETPIINLGVSINVRA